MNLCDFVDAWLQSGDCPANYKGIFSKKDYKNGLRDFSESALKDSLSAESLDLAYNACMKFFAAEKEGKADSWKDFPEAKKLVYAEAGAAVWEGYPLDASQRAVLKDMVLEGTRIISHEQATAIFDSKDKQGKYHSDNAAYFLEVCVSEDHSLSFVAIDNSSGDAFTEDFKSLEGARAWLGGMSVEDVEENIPAERGEKSLQELCDEPIVGETNIAGVRVVVDPKLADVTYNEAVNYIDYVEKQKSSKMDKLTELFINAHSGDNVALDWTLKPIQFERIRRITGYLVGNLDRWNNAKKQEERDRLKHTNAFGR